MPAAFVYTDQRAKYAYGPHHSSKPIRLALTSEITQAHGPLDGLVHTILAVEAPTDALLHFHAPAYRQVLEGVSEGIAVPTMHGYGIGPGDLRSFPASCVSQRWSLARRSR